MSHSRRDFLKASVGASALLSLSPGVPAVFERAALAAPERDWEAPAGTGEATVDDLIREANQAFEDYLAYQSQKRFADAARALETLERALKELSGRSGD